MNTRFRARQKQKVEDDLEALEAGARVALGQIEQDYGALVKELEAKSKATRQLAQQRYDELATVIREEVEKLVQQGEESAAATLQEMLAVLE